MRRVVVVTAAVVVLGGLFPAGAYADNRTVVTLLFQYAPSPVRVAAGDTLTYVNLDPLSGEGHSVTHAVPPGDQLFDSPITPLGAPSDVGGVSDLRPGSYNITCRVHPFMKGTLIVEFQ